MAQAPISMKCPLCKRGRPENAIRCGCGYEFNVFRSVSRIPAADLPNSYYLPSIHRSLRNFAEAIQRKKWRLPELDLPTSGPMCQRECNNSQIPNENSPPGN